MKYLLSKEMSFENSKNNLFSLVYREHKRVRQAQMFIINKSTRNSASKILFRENPEESSSWFKHFEVYYYENLRVNC